MKLMRMLVVVMLSSFLGFSQAFAGVTIDILKAGDGKTYPKFGQKVTVHYTGTLENGSKFDSSVDRNVPFIFTIGEGKVIRGWDEGVSKMSLGEKSKLTITPDNAYGVGGSGSAIPPNSTLIFEVELLKVE